MDGVYAVTTHSPVCLRTINDNTI